MKHIVRLASLEISSIKNVRNGRMIMPHARRKQPSRRGEEILGLYGQNGSGKTAVLVERIIRILTDADHPVDVDRLLIVTFTEAAAA